MQLLNQSVTCPWCNTYYAARPTTTNCMNCGGPLPRSINGDKGEKPSLPPRDLPKVFKQKVLLWKNTHVIIGLIFMIVGVPLIAVFGFGLLFAIIGYFLYKHGRRIGEEKIQAITNGVAAEGKILSVERDTSQSINGRNPFLITYTFAVKGGAEQLDKIVSWDENNLYRREGEDIWVVYIPENPEISSPWPPMV